MLYTWEGICGLLLSSKNEKFTNLKLIFLILFCIPSSVIGATLIFLGLYATLWGKEREKGDKLSEQTMSVESIEIKQEK
jgi:hypothetical protein